MSSRQRSVPPRVFLLTEIAVASSRFAFPTARPRERKLSLRVIQGCWRTVWVCACVRFARTACSPRFHVVLTGVVYVARYEERTTRVYVSHEREERRVTRRSTDDWTRAAPTSRFTFALLDHLWSLVADRSRMDLALGSRRLIIPCDDRRWKWRAHEAPKQLFASPGLGRWRTGEIRHASCFPESYELPNELSRKSVVNMIMCKYLDLEQIRYLLNDSRITDFFPRINRFFSYYT